MAARYKLIAKYGALVVWNAGTLQQNFLPLCFTEWSETGRGGCLGMACSVFAGLAYSCSPKQSWQGALSACSSCGAGMHLQGIQCRITAVWKWRVGFVYVTGNIESEQWHSSSTGECSVALPMKHIKHCLCSSWPQPEPPGGKLE